MRDRPFTMSSDPLIDITMVGDVVVLRPIGRLDLDSTHALVSAVDAASESDTTVVIDLDGSEQWTQTDPMFRGATPPYGTPVAGQMLPTIGVVAPGCVRLSSPNNHWTIDLTERRFCRSAQPVDRRFVGIDDWTPIRNIWAASDGVAVLTVDDSIISTATPWIAGVRAA